MGAGLVFVVCGSIGTGTCGPSLRCSLLRRRCQPSRLGKERQPVCGGSQKLVDQAKAQGNVWDTGVVPGHPWSQVLRLRFKSLWPRWVMAPKFGTQGPGWYSRQLLQKNLTEAKMRTKRRGFYRRVGAGCGLHRNPEWFHLRSCRGSRRPRCTLPAERDPSVADCQELLKINW